MKIGYIKYISQWDCAPCLIDAEMLSELNKCRSKLKSAGMVGVDNSGLGYGNISIRNNQKNQFFITGSQTSERPILSEEHIALVTKFNVDSNSLTCIGQTNASSESLSHAAVYKASANTNVVIHIHHRKLWESMCNVFPTTNPTALYGTPEIANSVANLISTNPSLYPPVIILAGHQDGIIAFGNTLDEITELLFCLCK